jgi:hypothetical protein
VRKASDGVRTQRTSIMLNGTKYGSMQEGTKMRTRQERMQYTKRIQNRRMRLANQWGITDKQKHPKRWGLFKGEFRKRPTKCQCRRCKSMNPKNHEKGSEKKKWEADEQKKKVKR